MQAESGNGPTVDWDHFLNDLRAVVHDGEELLKTGFVRAKQRAAAGAQAGDRLVRERPYQSLAVGFGLGLLAGFLISRSLRRPSEAEAE